MINDITDFLPKYPNINKEKDDFLNTYDGDFYTEIFKKKEFYDEKLEKFEPLPEKKGDLLKHQKIISRFFSSYTPYDSLLLVHGMGTGKTFAAISSIEKIKKENSTITEAIILAKGEGLLNNFKNELLDQCKDEYMPENILTLTEGEIVARTNKLVKKFYNFDYTFYKMASQLEKLSDSQIKNNFSNKIIVIDEVHNVRFKEEVEKKTVYVYNQIWRLLHNVKNCKILLMSGTPIKDSIDEFANILNLLLPTESQLPTDEDFVKEFFIKNENGIYSFKKDKIDILKEKLKGRVSYLKAVSSNVKKVFEGSKNVGNLKHFIVYEDFMSDFQSTHYRESYIIEGKKGVFIDSRQASLFIFPDGTWGDAGFSNKDNIEVKYNISIKNNKRIKSLYYTLSQNLKNQLKGETDEETLKNIEKYSSKYASCIRNILNAYKDKKKSFVYNEYVKGSGGILFSFLLELFGFEKGNVNVNTKKPRYILLNNVTSSSTEIKNLIKKFNEMENLYGEYITVIIGSSVISEGFSFYDIQEEHILTPHWNYSETDQAIARGYRFGSHKNLINAGIIPVLKIFQYVSIPNDRYDDYESIDLKMYEISEVKDVNIKNIEYLIKETAFDCALNYNRNYIEGYDSQRECEYKKCNYKCEEIPSDLYKDFNADEISTEAEESQEKESDEDESEKTEDSDEEINLSKFKKKEYKKPETEEIKLPIETIRWFFNYKNSKGKNINLNKLRFTKESEYSITPWKEAAIITKKIIEFFQTKKISITDATANVGGNSIDFYNNGIQIVNSVEIDPKTCEILKNNLEAYEYKTDNVYCEDYLNIYMDLKQDCVFFDPPWGGPEYMKKDKLDLFLGEINVIDIIYDLFFDKKIKLGVLKAPKNYNFDSLKNKFETYSIEKIEIFRGKKHSYNVFFIYVLEDAGEYDGAENIVLDKSTYQLYYNTDKIKILMSDIIELFKKYYFKIDFSMLLNYFNNYTIFEVVTALKNIINENKVIINKYGFPSFLKENNNIYFLTNNLSVESTYFSEFYTQNPIVLIKKIFLEEIDSIYFEKSSDFIKELFNLKDVSKMKNIINRLPLEIVEIILENSIIANEKNIQINKRQRDLILDILKNEYMKIVLDNGNSIIISSLLYRSNNILKCVETENIEDGWKICDELYIELFQNEIEKKKERAKENIYEGYYGTYSKDSFCIRSPDEPEKKDTRKKKSGKVCKTWTIPELLNFMIKIFKVPIPSENIPDINLKNNKKIWKEIKKNKNIKDEILKSKNIKTIYSPEEILNMSELEAQRIYYWDSQSAEPMCQQLKEFLDKEGLLIYDENCGTQNKRKK